MKVLVVTNAWPSLEAPIRGIFVQEQVESLGRRGLEVEVVAVESRGRPWRYGAGVPRVLARALRLRPDIVHAHYGLTGAVALPWRLAPMVVTYHGSDVHVPWQRRVSAGVARFAAANVCVSAALERALGAPRSEVIPCGVDMGHFRPLSRDEARRRLGVDPDEALILFAGARGNAVKNYPLLLRAAARLPEPRPRILELSGISRAEVPWLMAASDVLALTSHNEGSPMVVKEALACGLPIVSVRVGDVAERLTGLAGTHIVESTSQGVASGLSEVLGNRRRLGSEARARVPTLEGVAERLEALYRRLAGAAAN